MTIRIVMITVCACTIVRFISSLFVFAKLFSKFYFFFSSKM